MTTFRSTPKRSLSRAPAYYATPRFVRRPRLQQWWTLLHPPYTMMHLSFVVIGSALVTPVNASRLGVSVLAFFLAVGVGAHALDELHGRPLATSIPPWQLAVAAVVGLGGAVTFGVIGAVTTNVYLFVFIGVGVTLALGYNLELFNGRLHSDTIFALSWGGFPLLTAFFAQHGDLSWSAAGAATFASFASQAQRRLSSPARDLRRRTRSVSGTRVLNDGSEVAVNDDTILVPLEGALHSLCWASVALAVTFLFLRFLS